MTLGFHPHFIAFSSHLYIGNLHSLKMNSGDWNREARRHLDLENDDKDKRHGSKRIVY